METRKINNFTSSKSHVETINSLKITTKLLKILPYVKFKAVISETFKKRVDQQKN